MLLDFEAKIKDISLKYNTQLDTAKIKADADLDKMIMADRTKILESAQKSANVFSEQFKDINGPKRSSEERTGDGSIISSETIIRE
jgi:hypothetical protein